MIKLNNNIIEQKSFPDGTPLLKINKDNLNTNECNIIQWNYDNMQELFNLYAITRQVQAILGKKHIRLVLPYVPNARQDRVQNEKQDIFTLKWFCEIINSLEFERVTIIDIHSTVACALLNNCHSINNKRFFDLVQDKVNADIVFYPDNGSTKKYSEFIKEPYAYGIKKRDWESGKILGLDIVGDVEDKNILIVDDISSYGGTFFYSAKKLKELGAKDIYLLITHCENSIVNGELIKSGLIKKIYTTNSIYRENNDLIEVIYEF